MAYRAYQFTVFFGVLAQQIFAVAMGWLIYDRTSSALHLGYVGLAQFLPALLFAPLAGHLADSFPRTRLYQICLVGMGAGALVCAWLSFTPGSVSPFYVVLIALGCLRALEAPASSALLPQLVPATQLPGAVAWMSSTKQVANVLGPALGGIAYTQMGNPAQVFSLTSGFAFFGAVILATVPAVRPKGTIGGFRWESVAAGARYIRRNRLLLGAMSLDMFAVLFGGAVALLPVFAKDILLVGPEGLGILRSAPAFGSLIMAVTLARFPLNHAVGRRLFVAVGLFGVATTIMAVSQSFWLTAVVLAISGAANVVSVIIRQTLIQLQTPDEMRGRVSAVNQVFNLTSNQLGEFESGITASWWGPVGSVLVGGIGTLVVAGIWAVGFPELRRLEKFGGRHEQ